jgi:hypothetical protein
MVSHIDDDHIRGILDWTAALGKLKAAKLPLPDDIATLWHNSFDDMLGSDADQLRDAVKGAGIAADANGEIVLPDWMRKHYKDGALVLASVAQGRELRKNAEFLGIRANEGPGDPIVAPDAGTLSVPVWEDAPTAVHFTFVGPMQRELDALRKKWKQELPKLLAREAKEREKLAAAFSDESVFNLSSIVAVAELGGKRMLLTGDARGDLICKGLEAAELMTQDGTFHADLLKLPHHGSNRNVAPEFFERVTADHYVVSSDGDKFDNPDFDTLHWLRDARKEHPFVLYLPYPAVQRDAADRAGLNGFVAGMRDFGDMMTMFRKDQQDGLPYRVVFRDAAWQPGQRSVTVDLGSSPLRL